MTLTKQVESIISKNSDDIEKLCHYSEEEHKTFNEENKIDLDAIYKKEFSGEDGDIDDSDIDEEEDDDEGIEFGIDIDGGMLGDDMSIEEELSESIWNEHKSKYLFYHQTKKYKSGSEKSSKKYKYIVINIFNKQLLDILKKTMEVSDLYVSRPCIEIAYLYHAIHDIRYYRKEKEYNCYEFNKFADYIEFLFRHEYKKMDKMIKDNKIDYKSLWYYFDKVNTIYEVKFNDHKICYQHKSFSYSSIGAMVQQLSLNGEIFAVTANGLSKCTFTHNIPKYIGTKSLEFFKTSIVKLKESEYPKYKEFGRKTLSYIKGTHHVKIKGKQFINVQDKLGSVHKNNVRAIIDEDGMTKFDTRVFSFQELTGTIYEPDDISDNDLLTVFPYVSCYNLGSNKIWGMTHITEIHELKYNKEAYDSLVLDKLKKEHIKALITMHNKAKNKYNDIIEGKGEGLVFLLSGPPGVGKTLTAEACCEILEKPLYSVNVGDLGTNVETMEIIIERITEYITRWNAIMVINEADIFIERRESHTAHTNAMVSTFLKFLDYNTGIIFLTTNRLLDLDPAARNRVDLCLKYNELTKEDKIKIWTTLFKKWNIKEDTKIIKKLAGHKMNGRSIQKALKNSLYQLESKEIEITPNNISTEIDIFMKLHEDFNEGVRAEMYT